MRLDSRTVDTTSMGKKRNSFFVSPLDTARPFVYPAQYLSYSYVIMRTKVQNGPLFARLLYNIAIFPVQRLNHVR